MLKLSLLLIQLGTILLSARLVGLLFKRINQPQVVGEMVAGILLGPSFLGWLSPPTMAALFPPESLGFLNALGQVGLLVFIFLVGLKVDVKLLRTLGHTAVLTSHVSIVLPFFLGTLLALYLYPRLSDESVTFAGFGLFMGAAMSVTAFPVLARILAERRLLGTKLGTVAIVCAAVDDVTAWIILAFIVVLVRTSAQHGSILVNLILIIAFALIMIFGLRRLLARLEIQYRLQEKFTQNMIAFVLLLVLASASITEWLGIHTLFGAFLVGVIMPKERNFVRDLTEKLEGLPVILLLPLFFTATGLRTRIELISGAEMWFYCALIIIVATAGKLGGSMLSSRISGMTWREAGSLGILMNTRGLMELVILNIGFDIGVISPALFSMMVLMAIVTTFMTSPVLELVYRDQPATKETMIVNEQLA
jgi:Kef-type K+ transport system membrane component KefB